MATIGDVARRAGVTRTTVSHTLSGKRPVAAATRERVLDAIRELGFRPNAVARNLALRRTQTIGLSLPVDAHHRALSDTSYLRFIATIADRLGSHGYKLLCLISADLGVADLADLARDGHVDGMLLLELHLNDQRVTALQEIGLPFVAIGRPADTTGLIHVDADAMYATHIAMHHLFDLGHSRIALLADSTVQSFHYRALRGFQRLYEEVGRTVDPAQLLIITPSASLETILSPLLDPASDITALIVVSDNHIMPLLHILSEHGRRVPEDISVMALCDSPVMALARPSITTLTLPVDAMSRTAVDLLVAMLAGRPPDQDENIIPYGEMIVRRSTRRIGPPFTATGGTAQGSALSPDNPQDAATRRRAAISTTQTVATEGGQSGQ